MKKIFNLILEDADLIDLMSIIMDDDAEAALSFLKAHFHVKANELLQGG